MLERDTAGGARAAAGRAGGKLLLRLAAPGVGCAAGCDVAHLHLPRSIELDAALLPRSRSVLVGRGDGCDVQLDALQHPGMLSRQHCRLSCKLVAATDSGGRPTVCWQVEDLGSQNGTVVNGHTLRKKTPIAALADGDTLRFGVARGEHVSDACYEVHLM